MCDVERDSKYLDDVKEAKSKYASMIKDLEEKCKKDIDKISSEYVKESFRYPIGTIISSKYGVRIRVDKLNYIIDRHTGLPEICYKGVLMTTKGLPYKSGEVGTIFTSDLEEL